MFLSRQHFVQTNVLQSRVGFSQLTTINKNDCCSAATRMRLIDLFSCRRLLQGKEGQRYCEEGGLAKRPSTLCTLYLRTRDWAGSVKTCLEPKPKENGGRRRNILQGNQQGWLSRQRRRAITAPRSPFTLRGLILVGPVNHEGDQLFLPFSWTLLTKLYKSATPPAHAPGSNPPCYSLLELDFWD